MSYRFNSECDGCSACARQCPVGAIYGQFKERFDVDPALCVDCGVCGMICPREAVLDEHGAPAPRVGRQARPRPVLAPELCDGCGVCVDFCPFDCRTLVGRRFRGLPLVSHPERCVGCSECADACIKGAIVMKSRSPAAHFKSERIVVERMMSDEETTFHE